MGANTENTTMLEYKAGNVYRYNVKLERVCATIVAVENNNYYIL
jgi:hypothetical protein